MEITRTSKQAALRHGTYPCVGQLHTLNITRGCAGGCVFCYARETDDEGQVVGLDPSLPYLLRTRLESKELEPPRYVALSTSSDAFLGGEQVLRVARQCLEILVNRGIGIILSTRGEMPDDVIGLLSSHAPFVRVHLPLASMDDDYTATWEPGTAPPRRRLFLAQRLLRAGITPQIRMDPVIPYVNDESEQVRELISAVDSLGLQRFSVSFMHLRPGLHLQLEREAPALAKRMVLGSYPWLSRRPDSWHHLPLSQRSASLARIQNLAAERRLELNVCHCNNRDLSRASCALLPPQKPVPRGVQTSLFE